MGGGHHGLQRGDDFAPLAGFQAAVRVHPQALGGDALGGFLHQLHDVRLRGDVGRVDVVHAGANLVGVVEVLKRVQQLHVRARSLDGDHIGIHVRDGGNDVVELRIAHVGVDLRAVLHAVGADAKALDRPVQVVVPLALAQGQALAQRGLVDLDDAHAGFFQIQHFLADGQRQLLAGGGARLVVAHKRPVQDGDRAGEHALHGLGRQRLGVGNPLHRHGLGAGDVAKQNRRLDAARAVGLHPAELAESVALQLFAKVFDHVVALGLAMHQHVQAQGFLLAHAAGDFCLHGGLVFGRTDAPGLEVAAGAADVWRLREGANRRRWVGGQAQVGRLLLGADGVGALALAQGGGDGGHGSLHFRAVYARRGTALFQGSGVGGQCCLHAGTALVQRLAQHVQLVQFLLGKGQPVFYLGVEFFFAVQIDRHMQERAAGGQPQALAQALGQGFKPVQRGAQVGFPDIAAADHAQRQHLVRGQQADELLHVARIVRCIHVQPGHGQVGGQVFVVQQRAKVAGQQNFDLAAFELVVGGVQGVLPVGIQLGDQNRLVHLHPLHALGGQGVQQLGVHGQQALQQGQLVALVLGLAQGQVGDGADDDRLGIHALGAGLGQLLHQALGVQLELGIGREFGDDVVVIGIKPLGHLASGHAGAVARAAAPGHAKVLVQFAAGQTLHALGQVAQGEAHVQHLVVQGEIPHGHIVQRGLQLPVLLAQPGAQNIQLLSAGFAAPERFQAKFQFALRTDAGKTEVMNNGHKDCFLSTSWLDECNPIRVDV